MVVAKSVKWTATPTTANRQGEGADEVCGEGARGKGLGQAWPVDLVVTSSWLVQVPQPGPDHVIVVVLFEDASSFLLPSHTWLTWVFIVAGAPW